MPLLSEKDTKYLKKMFDEQLKDPVKVLIFVDDPSECEYCDLTKQVLEELSTIDGKIQLSSHHVKKEPELANSYRVEMTPAIILLDSNGQETGIRFYGVPSGHEFSTLIQDIIAVSNSKPVFFNEQQINQIKSINVPVRIRVFVTPTCPYCPKAVLMAHSAALINRNIVAEMIEANEFPELSMRYGVSSVPHTVINDVHEFIGAYPEHMFVQELMKAVRKI
ncbi:glutaredoxin [Thermotoga sp. Ku-13t]|uniref:protein disulfide oxidoreductase n=1 Tax=Thermotoga sp. Ku-13t TaxID=1755813 RepID=UPI0013ED1FA9|nr:thioredoxin family protein [Thermotoga sp. Ku-13t]KAF2957438.1 glutaredoxin [Thermotoga sp. Ku-13t]